MHPSSHLNQSVAVTINWISTFSFIFNEIRLFLVIISRSPVSFCLYGIFYSVVEGRQIERQKNIVRVLPIILEDRVLSFLLKRPGPLDDRGGATVGVSFRLYLRRRVCLLSYVYVYEQFKFVMFGGMWILFETILSLG